VNRCVGRQSLEDRTVNWTWNVLRVTRGLTSETLQKIYDTCITPSWPRTRGTRTPESSSFCLSHGPWMIVASPALFSHQRKETQRKRHTCETRWTKKTDQTQWTSSISLTDGSYGKIKTNGPSLWNQKKLRMLTKKNLRMEGQNEGTIGSTGSHNNGTPST
jgi:hypothetical protein